MNRKDSKKRVDKAITTIRSKFEKTSSKIEKKNKIQNRAPAGAFSRSLRKGFHFHPIHLKLQMDRRLDHKRKVLKI